MKLTALVITTLLAFIAEPASAQVGRWQLLGASREGGGRLYLLDTMTGCTWGLSTQVDKDRRLSYWELFERQGVAPGETAIRPLIPKQCLQIDGGVVWRDLPSN